MTAIRIPDRMAKLERDARGYPIPVTVLRGTDGRPHFTINNEAARQRVIVQDRCPICGQRLLRGRWLVGGPGSAFHARGAYIDPPMHDECVHYALQACPYLAAPSYSRRIDDKTLTPEARKAAGLLFDQTMDPTRPELFVAVMFIGQPRWINDFVAGIPVVRHLQPRKPYRKVEYWRHGQQLDPAEGARLAEPMVNALDRLKQHRK